MIIVWPSGQQAGQPVVLPQLTGSQVIDWEYYRRTGVAVPAVVVITSFSVGQLFSYIRV